MTPKKGGRPKKYDENGKKLNHHLSKKYEKIEIETDEVPISDVIKEHEIPRLYEKASGKKHQPTEDFRQVVRRCGILGVPKKTIAALVGTSLPVLDEIYGEELRLARARISSEVLGKFLWNCLNGGEYGQGDVNAQKFFLKTKAGFVEAKAVEKSAETAVNPSISVSIYQNGEAKKRDEPIEVTNE